MNKYNGDEEASSLLILSLLLLASLWISKAIEAGEIRNVISPPADLSGICVGSEVILEFGASFEGQGSMAVTNINGSFSDFIFEGFIARMKSTYL